MSINIDSKLNDEKGFWDISVEGELDVSTADKLKEYLHNLADEKILDMKINLEKLEESLLKAEKGEIEWLGEISEQWETVALPRSVSR